MLFFFFIYIRLSRLLLEGRTKMVSAHCFFVFFFFESHLKFYRPHCRSCNVVVHCYIHTLFFFFYLYSSFQIVVGGQN